MDYTIQTENLGKKYDTHWAVQNIEIHVPKGKIYGLLGRNGAGKTTIMKMLLGLAKTSAGKIILFQHPITGYPNEIYRRIGSTIETPGFYPNMTATENLAIFARLRGKIDWEEIRHVLSVVNLPYQDKKIFSNYSLGMKQRLAIANAIMNSPDLLILDEPTNGLDPIGIAEMRELIQKLSQEYGKTVLISSHQLAEIEQLVDWIGIIHEGKMLEECSYQELKEKEQPYIRLQTPQVENVSQYLIDTLRIKNFKRTEHTLSIFDFKYSTSELNRNLILAGFEIEELMICRNNLEDYFRKLTGGVGIA